MARTVEQDLGAREGLGPHPDAGICAECRGEEAGQEREEVEGVGLHRWE
jgi:hypothetical protein